MTRENILEECIHSLKKGNCIILELPTGFGKTALSLKLSNYLLASQWYKDKKEINILILVAKIVHKQTWADEIRKWGSIKHSTAKINIRMECYESLHKCCDDNWDIVLSDEVHHLSEARQKILKAMNFDYFLGLSATIPRNLKWWFKNTYAAKVISCDITEAIEADVLPEPQILLFPLTLDNIIPSETWEINPKAKGPVVYGEYKYLWKYKKAKQHAILSCTQKQKSNELNALILWEKNRYLRSRNAALEQLWLRHCSQRLEYYADIKMPVVKEILKKLRKQRTITFCKTITQAESLCRHCIHSKNSNSDAIYNDFNAKKINHISAVNILNENANLVDCKYAVFCNLSSSDVVIPQRIGRSLRHKHPVIIVPYFANTREEEIVNKMFSEYNKEYIKIIESIEEIK